jgi:hypothetical protein
MSDNRITLRDLLIELPRDLARLLHERDGAARLVKRLPEHFSPEELRGGCRGRRLWELVGLYYQNLQPPRHRDALSIFSGLYDHMLLAQEQTGERIEKGMPLVWMRDSYRAIGFPAHAKRYMMLTLCEDAVSDEGIVDPERGCYFRLVWRHGLPDAETKRYAKEAYDRYLDNQEAGMFPEYLLLGLDQNWMTELSAPDEAGQYTANTRYIQYLQSQLGEPTGKMLETLADYLITCMPGCRTARRQRSHSTEYDLICSVDGFEVDFRSELGRYFVCECKDWKSPADYTTMAKFSRVLDSTKSRFGILFSKKGISGETERKYAANEQQKIFQDRGMVIVVVDQNDLDRVAQGANFITLLRRKYEQVRLDLT